VSCGNLDFLFPFRGFMVRNPLMNKSMAVKYARNLAHMRENKILYRSLVGEDWTEEYVT